MPGTLESELPEESGVAKDSHNGMENAGQQAQAPTANMKAPRKRFVGRKTAEAQQPPKTNSAVEESSGTLQKGLFHTLHGDEM